MIDFYSFGSISVNGEFFDSDVIIYPDRINSSWWRKEGHNLCLEDIKEIFEYKPEILVIGKGNPGLMKVPKEIEKKIIARGIEVIISKTSKAVEQYNKISGIKRAVAALHLTC